MDANAIVPDNKKVDVSQFKGISHVHGYPRCLFIALSESPLLLHPCHSSLWTAEPISYFITARFLMGVLVKLKHCYIHIQDASWACPAKLVVWNRKLAV
jgi:hypothetical protein